MKRIMLSLFLVLCLLVSCGAWAEEAGQAPALTADVLILFTSDVHCGIDQNFGYAGLQAIRDAAVASGNRVLLVDDGDSIQGEAIGILTLGQSSIRLMNAIGYDVAVPGNHEFDYGRERFFELAEMAEFPYISCNFRKEGKPLLDPYRIFDLGDVRIAFVGATTPETIVSATPLEFQDEEGNFIYDFCQGGDGSAFYAAVQDAVDSARAEGADYVFLIAHLGNEASCIPYTYADVIGHTTGITAVLDGHSHDTDKVVMKNRDGEAVIRQACGTKLAQVGWLRISASDGSVDTGLYNWSNSVPAATLLGIDNEMSRLVAKELDNISALLAEVIGTNHVFLTVDDVQAKDMNGVPVRIIRRAETNMGDLAADAFRLTAGTDIGLINGGSIRTNLPEGPVTRKDVMAVFPFGNEVVVVNVKGSQLLDALEWGARVVPEENGGFLHVSGLTYEIDTSIPSSCTMDSNGLFTGVSGERRVRNVMVGGEPLDPDKTYSVAGQDYLITDQGDGNTVFAGLPVVRSMDDLDFGLLARFIQVNLNGEIGKEYENPYGQERIVAVGAPETGE